MYVGLSLCMSVAYLLCIYELDTHIDNVGAETENASNKHDLDLV
jgi:hypothetical protein